MHVLYNPTRKYRPFLQLAREAGADVAGCLARAGLSEAEFLDPITRVPRARAVALCRALVELGCAGEAGLLAAAYAQPGDLDVLGYLMKHSSTPLAAVRQLARYARLVGDAAEFAVETSAERVTVKGRLSGGRRMLPAMADYTAATLFRHLCELTAGLAQPLEVHLPRPKPRWANKHRRCFADARIRYDAEWATLIYSAPVMQLALPASDPQLLAILERRADDILKALPVQSSTLDQIRSCICDGIQARDLAASSIAHRLGMSERTLRRRLAQCGSSYRAVLEDVRRELALQLLRDEHSSIAAVAERLGFDDASAFARSFRGWMGVPPAQYRRRVTAVEV
ncbi:MAG TPA: AraC family transcriptional regulator ligand-binding domain-containing protein [Polyangiales bacterium]|nr:AraC family transcriptional regulator ligand-binding domain-containing protein [Polyangiales bacterium]